MAETTWRSHPIVIEVRGAEIRYPGTEIEVRLPADWIGYGYLEGLPAADGDSIDVVLGPDFASDWDGPVFVAEQLDPSDGSPIQSKCLLGFQRKDEAIAAFEQLWPAEMLGRFAEVDPDKFEHTVLPSLITPPDEAREPSDVPDAAEAPETRTAAGPDVIVWHKLRIVLEARGGEQRPTGDEQQLPVEFRGIGYFEGLEDRSDRDGQELDVVVGPGDLDGPVFLAVQLDDRGAFRQFKSFLAFGSAAEVEAAFKLIWRPDTLGGVWSVPAKRFRKLVLPRLTKKSTLTRESVLSRHPHAVVRSARQDGSRPLTHRTAILQLEIDPHSIQPPHEPRNTAKLERLTNALRSEGWNGRQILVYRSGGNYVALTGSHRLAAAKAAGLIRIPVLLIEDKDLDDVTFTQLDEASSNYSRLEALDRALKAKPETKPAYELMIQELIEKHKVNTRTSSVKEAEKLTRKRYRQVVQRAAKAKLLGEIQGLEVYRVNGTWVRDNLDATFAHAANYLGSSWIPKGEIWVDAALDDKDLAAALVCQLVMVEDLQRGGEDSAADAAEAGQMAAEEFRAAYDDGKSPFKQVEKWFARPIEVSGDDPDLLMAEPADAVDTPFAVQGRRRRRRKHQRDRVFRPSWYLPEGGRVAFSAGYAPPAAADGIATGVVLLKPGARILHMSEASLKTHGLSYEIGDGEDGQGCEDGVRTASAASDRDSATTVVGARDLVAYDLAAMVRAQMAAIEKLTAAVEQLRTVSQNKFDAIQTEDRLIILDPKAVETEPVRKRWLTASRTDVEAA